ncbi:transposase [Actinoplanes sp. ATCC 53533]|uniref:transposase n=1 Tax=Actinoplanes sp. ATCC 53533 TaxID=1288362 RepID=UPI001F2BEFDF|nr:transposase [Actinoplanes sp. ATCC 53533]
MQAYRFALDLTPSQERAVWSHAGAGRKAHNWALARVKAVLDQRAAERSYGLADDALTPALRWSLPALRKAWNAAKEQVAPWWRECSKEAFNTGLDALARGLKNWSDSRTGKRAGRKVGFPRFKTKHRTTPSVRFTTGTIRVEPDRKHVVLPRLGRLKLHESARKLARSKRWLRAKARLGRAHARVANLRRDGLHKLTTRLAREHATVVVEDLNVAGMMANRRLARHVADAGKRLPGTAPAGKTGTVPPQGRAAA